MILTTPEGQRVNTSQGDFGFSLILLPKGFRNSKTLYNHQT